VIARDSSFDILMQDSPRIGFVPTLSGPMEGIPGAGTTWTRHRPLRAVSAGQRGPGRIECPQQPPAMTFVDVPPRSFHGRFYSFVQRRWKTPSVWVFLAGVGCLTVPETHYSGFVTDLNNHDYEGAIVVLSAAAIGEEDSSYVVRAPKPATASYQYVAPAAPQAVEEQQCFLQHFVDRKWNTEYVWVQIPEIGNVTVPSDFSEAFVAEVNKPDFASACNILVQAAAKDTAGVAETAGK
jgi:hypothetical protein